MAPPVVAENLQPPRTESPTAPPAADSIPAAPNPDPEAPEDDPRRTLKAGGKVKLAFRKPRFRLEQIIGDEVIPLREIYESYDAPIYQTVPDPVTGNKARHNLIHLRNTPGGLEVRPLDTINGLFVRIVRPMRLADKTRFRVGHYLIEARIPPAEPSVEAKRVPGEAFLAKGMQVHGELVFIRPDDSPGPSFPVVVDVVIGRGGPGDPPVNVPLLDDDVSRLHARVAAKGGDLILFNLSKTSGTFIEADGPTFLDDGDCFRVGELVLQLTRIN